MSWLEVSLLIVPYGIETWVSKREKKEGNWLLIVPYGIETPFRHSSLCGPASFNCTLWN